MLFPIMAASAIAIAATATGVAPAPDQAAAPAPTLVFAFSAEVTLAPPIEQGVVDGRRLRFVPITGGRVYGPRLQGSVVSGGGDWQAIGTDGLTEVSARYTLKATDGTVIDVVNTGVRTATAAVTQAIANGETVDPGAYYFRTSPRFTVTAGPHERLRRTMFVARGVRLPDRVVIDFYTIL